MKKEKNKHGKSMKAESEKVLKKLLEVCQIFHTPMFASIIITDDNEHIEYDNIVYSAQSHMVRLADDRIRKHMLIANGFEAIKHMDKEEEDELGIEEKLPGSVKNKPMSVYSLDEKNMQELMAEIDRVLMISETHDTSVFVSVAVSNSEHDTQYISRYRIPPSQSSLKHSQIERHILVSEKAFDAVPMRDAVSFDMEEVFGGYGE